MTTAPTMQDAALERVPDQSIEDILSILPHRFPFVLIDRVERIVRNQSGVGIKAIGFNEPWFQGHFPNNPIMPGVLILEAMAQAASVIYCASNGVTMLNRKVYFVSVDRARFRKPVVPGCLLELHIDKLRERIGTNVLWRCLCRARVAEDVVADAIATAMMFSDGQPFKHSS